MVQLLLPSDAEQAVIDHLSAHVLIGTSLPEVLPDQFARVAQVGGAQRDLVTDTPMLTIEGFDRYSESGARELTEFLLAVVQSAVLTGTLGSVPCYRVQVTGLPQNYPLPSVPDHFRYITTVAPDLRRRVLNL